MTECDEIALGLLPGYLHWIAGTMQLRGNCMAASREYTRQRMLDDETITVTDNIAFSLFRFASKECNK